MTPAKRFEHLNRQWRDRVRAFPVEEGGWRFNRCRGPAEPSQGWKLHVSATILNAHEVFDHVQPLLEGRSVLFKVHSDLNQLYWFNSGVQAFAQVGKFLTVYPRSEQEAVELARKLHAATRGLAGPVVPFDQQYRKGSLVYYRYGAFGPSGLSRESRRLGPGRIFDQAGRPHLDQRAPGHAVPAWLNDPFLGRRRAPAQTPPFGPICRDFLVYGGLSQRGKGGVYEALDLRMAPARRCILKEGRRWGEVDWSGTDGRSRLAHEGRVLRQLQAAGLPVPRVLDEFVQEGNRYLVLERLPGRPLLWGRRNQRRLRLVGWRCAERVRDQVGAALDTLHRLGWVWRDCCPTNLLAHGSKLWLIDFEGACRLEEINVIPWATQGFTPPGEPQMFCRRPGTLEDDYALGVTCFLLATGRLPPEKRAAREGLLRRHGCPRGLRLRLAELLDYRS